MAAWMGKPGVAVVKKKKKKNKIGQIAEVSKDKGVHPLRDEL